MPTGMEQVARRLVITGRVQGVGYRESLVHHAAGRGLVGWVRNRADGTVEAWLQGDEQAVLAMVAWCGRGPPAAHVTDVAVTELDCDPALRQFERRRTA